MFDITLTFDNGPEPLVTPGVLDALKARGVKATFFVIGERATAHPELVARAHEEGHVIANHTWSHTVPLGDRPLNGEAVEEIKKAQQAIARYAHPSRFFRPFADGVVGPKLLNREAVQHLCDNDYTCVLWNVLGEEWVSREGWVEPAVERCKAQDWSLLVVHDLLEDAMRHFPRFLDRLIEEGATFRMDFPPDCVLIDRGRITQPLSRYVAGGWDDASVAG